MAKMTKLYYHKIFQPGQMPTVYGHVAEPLDDGWNMVKVPTSKVKANLARSHRPLLTKTEYEELIEVIEVEPEEVEPEEVDTPED